MPKLILSEITGSVFACFFKVNNSLVYGSLEKVHDRTFLIQSRKLGLRWVSQHPVNLFYGGHEVGGHFADHNAVGTVILELQAAEVIHEEYQHRLIHYLKTTDTESGSLLNFGKKLRYKRKIFSNDLN